MAIVQVRERYQGRESRSTLGADGKVTRTAKRYYLVETDDVADGPAAAEAASAGGVVVPAVGTSWKGMTLKERKANPVDDDQKVFLVECDYTSEANPPEDGQQQTEDPLQRPPDVTYDAEESSEGRYLDAKGKPIKNSAGETYDPPIEFPVADEQITIERNEATFNRSLYKSYANAVNEDAFLGDPPGTWRIKPIKGRKVFENGKVYWRVSFTLVHREDGWNRKLLDQGFYEKSTTGTSSSGVSLVRIKDKDGKAKSTPTLLDGNGKRLADGADPKYITIADAFTKKPFAPLGFPSA